MAELNNPYARELEDALKKGDLVAELNEKEFEEIDDKNSPNVAAVDALIGKIKFRKLEEGENKEEMASKNKQLIAEIQGLNCQIGNQRMQKEGRNDASALPKIIFEKC